MRWTTCGRSLPDWGAIADQIRVLPPLSGATRFVAIDGHGGAGKSTAATRLAKALGGVPIVHTDDFASWDNPVDWWPSLISEVLEPLAKGERATFVPTSWDGIARSPIEVPPAETVIVEGVTSSREAFRKYMAFSIWIDAPAMCVFGVDSIATGRRRARSGRVGLPRKTNTWRVSNRLSTQISSCPAWIRKVAA